MVLKKMNQSVLLLKVIFKLENVPLLYFVYFIQMVLSGLQLLGSWGTLDN